jgi:VWFA-related protein
VVVTDQSGAPVSGLDQKDFTLLDDGKPAKIVSFSGFDETTARPDPPVKVILVIDAADHSKDEISDVQYGIEKFLRQNGGQLAQPVEIYRLSDAGLSVTPEPSTDGYALAEAISQKRGLREVPLDHGDYNLELSTAAPSPSYQNQSFHPQSALRALGSIVLEERRKPGRKLLVWVGYGVPGEEDYGRSVRFDTQHAGQFEWITEFSTRMRQARIAFYGVTFYQKPDRRFPYQRFLRGVTTAEQVQPGNFAFEVLATQSGGLAQEEPDNDLARLIGKCVQDGSNYYTISFDAPRTDQPDEYHDLKVELGKPELVARTSTGYYDQPVYYDQPFVASERITVNQLEQILERAQGGPDAELARRLSGMELRERLSSEKLSSWKVRLKGEKAQAALVALADASAFLHPPPSEIPTLAAPDTEARQAMLSSTVDFLEKTVPKLPDFFATRSTARYEEPPLKENQTWKTAGSDRSLHLAGTSQATILYRNGNEVVDLETAKGKKPEREHRRLELTGAFGPILSVVILDAASSELVWSHWEQGSAGPLAVFRYRVPKGESHYAVTYRGVLDYRDEAGVFQRLTGYHGEITIDPQSGAIQRMTLEADLEPNLPMIRSAVMVEYGPVEIGGNTHICLVRSVSIGRVRKIFSIYEWGQSFRVYGPFETLLDDVSYGKYHMFHGEARVLSGFSDAPNDNK